MFRKREALEFFAFEKKSRRLIGSIGFPRLSWALGKFEVGYWISTSYTGQGFCVEGVSALTQLAFNKLAARRVEIRIDANNKRSIRVAELCGFPYEGTLRNDSITPTGRNCSIAVYAAINFAEIKRQRKRRRPEVVET